MKRFFTYLIILLCAVNAFAQNYNELSGVKITNDFLIGKTDFLTDTNFIKIAEKYTSLRSYNAYTQKATYGAFKEMYYAALKDGITLKVISSSRNFWIQKYIWESKWKKNKIANKRERAKHILRYNAMPGISRHHWGTELDFISTKVEFWETEKGKKVYNWLKRNAHRYGFYQPYTHKKESSREGFNEEKWHWSYFPLSNEYFKRYKSDINYSNFPDFLGSEYVEDLQIIEKYVFGVSTPPVK